VRIDPKYRPELVAYKGEDRPNLQHTFLDKNLLVACDGTMLVTVPVELGDGDVEGQVSKEALAAARKAKTNIEAGETTLKVGGTIFARPDLKGYSLPPWRESITEPGPGMSVGLNVTKLVAIAKALGTEIIGLHFDDSGVRDGVYMGHIHVSAEYSTKGEYGILMPYRIAALRGAL